MDFEVNLTNEPNILSPELIQELGGYTENDLIITNKRKKQKQKHDSDTKDVKPSEEFIDQAKRLSKKAKKRYEQFQRRQIKEEKKVHYFEELQKYQISDESRELLTSTRDIGQSATLKKLLAKLHKRYKAGLVLSPEEIALLFPEGINISSEQGPQLLEPDTEKVASDMTLDIQKPQPIASQSTSASSPHAVEQTQKLECKAVEETEVMVDIFSFVPADVKTSHDNEIKTKKSKKRKSVSLEEDAKTNSNTSNSSVNNEHESMAIKPVGFSLLQQLKSLKSKFQTKAAESFPKTDTVQEDISHLETCQNESSLISATAEVDIEKDQQTNAFTPYVPEPIQLPVDSYTSRVIVDSMPITQKPITQTRYIYVDRDPLIQEKRILLPVYGMEQEIVEAINSNDVVILCGETGCGKSTQVPQFLYEYGYGRDGMIGITQPRRVAAIATAERVAEELGSTKFSNLKRNRSHDVVGYQIRFDSSTVGENTKIKFMTDGILLREITTDLLIRSYSVIILDEAHERNINTDILLGMISRSISLRKQHYLEEVKMWNTLSEEERSNYSEPLQPLKLVIMSATLRVEDFCNPVLFPIPPPVIKIEARQYPVVTHFARRTELADYLRETYKKICEIHRKLPEGGVLVFLTGKREVLHMCRRLEKKLNHVKNRKREMDNSQRLENEQIDSNHLLQGIDSLEEDFLNDTYDNMNNDDFSSEGSESDHEEDSNDVDPNPDNDHDHDHGNDNDNDNKISFGLSDKKIPSSGSEKESEKKIEASLIEDNNSMSMRNKMLREALGIPIKLHEDPIIQSTGNDFISPENEITNIPTKAFILPLYAMMSSSEQQRVFHPPPADHRLIVIATNVAETSITIPGIKYVVDCGRQKERITDISTGISKYEVCWISKASAEQRKGRAGRTGPGHCYRLYSSAFFDQHMKLFKPAEILSTPLEDLFLQMRSMGIHDIEKFPFPTPPPKIAVVKAINLLLNLGAIIKPIVKIPYSLISSTHDQSQSTLILREQGYISDLGKLLARFPINPRYAKILVMGYRGEILHHAISLVAILVDKSPFLLVTTSANNENESDQDSDRDNVDEINETKKNRKEDRNQLRKHPHGDSLAQLRAFGAALYSSSTTILSSMKLEFFCQQYNLSQPIIEKAKELRQQLKLICSSIFNLSIEEIVSKDKEFNPPTKQQETELRQILLTGFCDCIAKRAPPGSIVPKQGEKLSHRKRLTAFLSCDPNILVPLYIHPQSSLYQSDPTADLPTYIIYTSLLKNDTGNTTYMNCVTAIHPSWIPWLAMDSPLLKWSEPLTSPAPFYDEESDSIQCFVIPKYGVHNWELSPVKRSLDECVKYQLQRSESSFSTSSSMIVESSPLGYRKRDLVYRWFGRLLLEGVIFPELKHFFRNENMKISPSAMTDMKLDPKISGLLMKLVKNKILSKKSLIKKFQSESSFLLEEIEGFLVLTSRKSFRHEWILFTSKFQKI